MMLVVMVVMMMMNADGAICKAHIICNQTELKALEVTSLAALAEFGWTLGKGDCSDSV